MYTRHVVCLAQSCHKAVENAIHANSFSAFGVYSVILALEVHITAKFLLVIIHVLQCLKW